MAGGPIIGLYQPYPHTYGGVQSVVLKLARALPTYGFQPLVICPERGRFTRLLEEESLPFLISDPGPAWHVYGRGSQGLSYLLSPARALALVRYWRRLASDLRQHHVAFLHCNDYRGVLMAAPAARCLRLPVLWHMHGFVPSLPANLLAAALVHWTVPVSKGMLEDLPRWVFGKCQVIHNGVEPLDRNVAAPAQTDPPIVLAVGTLHPRKGYETLIDAFPKISAQWPTAECWIAGPDYAEGAYTRRLQAQIEQLNLTRQVRLLGACSDVAQLMKRSRLLCVPSHIEPFGLVALEAMLASKPVVASRTGGLPEIILEGRTGLLVDRGNSSALAEAITELLHDPQKAERLGQAGKERAQIHFSQERMIEAFAAFYRSRLEEVGAIGTQAGDGAVPLLTKTSGALVANPPVWTKHFERP